MENDASRMIKIRFRNLDYQIRTKELTFLFKALERIREGRCEARIKSNRDILNLMDRHNLYDEYFLNKMSKLRKRNAKCKS